MISYSTQIRVRYKDTDQMGIMHHSNYVVLYEQARTEWLRAMGLTYAEIERRGVMSPIIEVHSRYHYPAFYDEVLTVKVSIDEMPTARLIVASEVYNEAGKLINTGSVTLGFMNSATRRPCRVPEWFTEALEEYIAKQNQ
ncbi:MAG: acyl-CoA thioesterase [Alistipes sp.]|nr:acyl-CoA thioesterase [Alistipes sp.]MBQ5704358.1 acyl-CoA thioesterase [Alistipes sp.]MBQ5922932.1 acyl-CoA thioesterase [Alistipes sp.]MBQ6581923.1 acyl-CoA thioesterase [Alistipes sp.]